MRDTQSLRPILSLRAMAEAPMPCLASARLGSRNEGLIYASQRASAEYARAAGLLIGELKALPGRWSAHQIDHCGRQRWSA